ncbi:hypothetical protein R4K48_11380 [Brachyspira pulli]|uniref:hypothetical protein n=1 Tax=Brachyspira pulli TaxID=310721 RepID=UPI0030068021
MNLKYIVFVRFSELSLSSPELFSPALFPEPLPKLSSFEPLLFPSLLLLEEF